MANVRDDYEKQRREMREQRLKDALAFKSNPRRDLIQREEIMRREAGAEQAWVTREGQIGPNERLALYRDHPMFSQPLTWRSWLPGNRSSITGYASVRTMSVMSSTNTTHPADYHNGRILYVQWVPMLTPGEEAEAIHAEERLPYQWQYVVSDAMLLSGLIPLILPKGENQYESHVRGSIYDILTHHGFEGPLPSGKVRALRLALSETGLENTHVIRAYVMRDRPDYQRWHRRSRTPAGPFWLFRSPVQGLRADTFLQAAEQFRKKGKRLADAIKKARLDPYTQEFGLTVNMLETLGGVPLPKDGEPNE